MKQDGQAVFRFAVRKTEEMCRRLLDAQRPAAGRHRPDGLAPGQPPHHPVGRRAARFPAEKVVINIANYGNTTAATIPLALNDAVEDGRLKKGSLVLVTSVGAGFTVGALLLRWAI